MEKKESGVGGFDDSSVEPGVWRYAMATRVRVIVDAADYFALMQQAMLKARRRLLMIGWDFDTRIHLSTGRRWWQRMTRRGQYPRRLGNFLYWLTRRNKQLEIRILKWSYGWFKFLGRGTMAFDLIRWAPHRRLDFKFDTAHPIGCSHHQKIVVVDNTVAVCGGIDMSDGRWDTREHRPDDRRRRRPGGSLYGPWHDITMMMEGDIACALDELGRDRWVRAGGKPLAELPDDDDSAWPDDLAPQVENVEIGIARTRAPYKDDDGVDEIEQLFLRQIAAAKHFIYSENQYFASRKVAEAIAKRLAEPDPPEIILIQPESADGIVEATAMDPARDRLIMALREVDHAGRFHIYAPYSGEEAIYVHAKLTIVDDTILRVGSANFNNRSLGLDSECDIFIDCSRPANGNCGPAIRAVRLSLLAEHCGIEEDEVEQRLDQAGSMAALIAAPEGSKNRSLRPIEHDQVGDLEADLAEQSILDPEEPAQMFQLTTARRGLFRPGSLLAKALNKAKRKHG